MSDKSQTNFAVWMSFFHLLCTKKSQSMKKLFIIILMQLALLAYSQQEVKPDSIATSLEEEPVTADTQIGANTFEYRIVSNSAI